MFHGNHIEVIAHAVAGDHGAGDPGGLLDIVGGAGGDGVELQLFRRSSRRQGSDLVFKLGAGIEIVVSFLYLHRVAKRTAGAGDNRDLLYRGAVALQSRNQGMTDFMIGDHALFFIGQNGVLLLIAGEDHFDAFFEISLADGLSSFPDRPQRAFVDDVGKLGSAGPAGHAGNLGEVDIGVHFDLCGMDAKNILTAFLIRQFYRNSAVESSRPQQSGIEVLRPVGRGENDYTVVAFKAVHLGEKLVERLFPFVVAAEAAGNPLSADRIDFIDEHDTGRFLLGLAEEIPHLGSTHTDEHLHEFRSADREEGHVGLAGDSLCEHRFSGSRRPYQQDALWHGGADLGISRRIVKIGDDLLQGFLGLVFSRDILEENAGCGFDVDSGIGFAHVEHQGIAAFPVHHPAHHQLSQGNEDKDRQYPGEQEADPGRCLFGDL